MSNLCQFFFPLRFLWMLLISMIYQIFVKSFLNLCQIFVNSFSLSVSCECFSFQWFIKALSNLFQIFVKSKSFSRECYFLQWFFENIHHLPFVEERRQNCVPFGNTLTNLPFSRMDLKRYFWFYITNWSHYYVYINTQWIEATVIGISFSQESCGGLEDGSWGTGRA